MKHYVYRIDNLINGKYYIGKHSAKSLDNDYMGSGPLIIKAIDKWGIENFKKTILKTFPTSDEAFAYEAEVVTMKEVNDPMCYNLMPGGKGRQKVFTDEELEERKKERGRKYNQSPAGKDAHRKYEQSPKGKEHKHEYNKEYYHTPKGKESNRKAHRKYVQSPAGKDAQHKANLKFREQNPDYMKEYGRKYREQKKLEKEAKSR